MIPAVYNDKQYVVDILTYSFADNPSVNLAVKQGGDKLLYIRRLMEYSFELCFRFGAIYLSEDKKACALILYPDKNKTDLKAALLAIKLIIGSIGLSNLSKVLRREKLVKQLHPATLFLHLWYIGVDPNDQHTGIGTKLLLEVLQEGKRLNRNIYLETSVKRNIGWYKKYGFEVYATLEFASTLYLLRN